MADSVALELYQDSAGLFYCRVVDANGVSGQWMALAAGTQMAMTQVKSDLRSWYPSAVIRDVVTSPPEGDDAILWL